MNQVDNKILQIVQQVTDTYTGVLAHDAINVYDAAIVAYEFSGEPIMTDVDFDILKAWLISNDLLEFKAGATIPSCYAKKTLAYPMLSIQSIHQQDFPAQQNLIDFLNAKYLNNAPEEFYLSWKLDGLAIQIEYDDDGKLMHALTRGERIAGLDVTDRLRHAIPTTVPNNIKCIIGEVVIPVKAFEEHLSHIYKNERNAAAGLINASKDEYKQSLCKHLHIVAFKVLYNNGSMSFADESSIADIDTIDGFDILTNISTIQNQLFDRLNLFNTARSSWLYRTDGVIIASKKCDLDAIKNGMYYAYTAFKFTALQATTKIIDIDFRLRNNGDLFPRAILEPVELDGSTVRHTSLFNYANMLRHGLFPGAEIIIVKSGDIIPHVELVTKPVFETEQFKQQHDIDLCKFDGVNIKSTKDVTLKRFISGIHMLNLKDVGTSMAIKLYDAGYQNALQLFDFDASNLEKITGRILKTEQKTIDAITKRFTKIHLDHLILSLREIGIGSVSSRNIALFLKQFEDTFIEINDLYTLDAKFNVESFQIAKLITTLTDAIIAKSLEHKFNVYERTFFESTMFLMLIETICHKLHRIVFIEEQKVQEISTNAIKIMLTGSPKQFGFSTKAVFLEELAKHRAFVEVGNIKECDILIADNIDGNSNKLKTARNLGKEITTYSEIFEL